MNFNAIIDIDDKPELHLARLLILISTLTKQKQIKKIDGITKLVKLDFLLRYPVALKRALDWSGISKTNVFKMEKHEWTSVESTMIRFKYGPWDKRYRLFLAILESYGLLRIEKVKETIYIEITKEGEKIASKLEEQEEFQQYVERSKIIWRNFSHMAGSKLKDLMYEIIPEIKTTKYGDVLNF